MKISEQVLRTFGYLSEIFLTSGRWTIVVTGAQADVVRVEPFEALELDLTLLWNEPLATFR